MPAHTTETRQLIESFIELTNERDFDRIPEVFAESVLWRTPAAPDGEARGHDEVEATMQKVMSGFPDFHAELTDVVTSGSTGMCEVRFTMTHEGEFEGIPPTGQEVELPAMSKWTVADGEIRELHDYVNMQQFLEQLGVAEEVD